MFVQIIHFGMGTGAKMQDVLEDKVGMVVNAFVQKDLILTELFA